MSERTITQAQHETVSRAAKLLLAYIDTMPQSCWEEIDSSVVAMVGFDRDWADEVMYAPEKAEYTDILQVATFALDYIEQIPDGIIPLEMVGKYDISWAKSAIS